jgi:hypothetical protein
MWSIMRPSSAALCVRQRRKSWPVELVWMTLFSAATFPQHPGQKQYELFHDSALHRAARGESNGV